MSDVLTVKDLIRAKELLEENAKSGPGPIQCKHVWTGKQVSGQRYGVSCCWECCKAYDDAFKEIVAKVTPPTRADQEEK